MIYRTLFLAAALLMVFVAAGCSSGHTAYRVSTGKTLYATSFDTAPTESGWVAYRKGKAVEENLWMHGLDGTDGHCLRIFKDYCESPVIAIEPFKYYAVRFRSASDNKVYWSAQFFDETGKRLAADHYSSVDASDGFTDEAFCFRGRPEVGTVRIRLHGAGFPQYVDDLSVSEVTPAQAARWADSVYATIPPLHWRPDADRWTQIPRAIERMREGGRLRVVMLGDSIVNDISNSAWDALVERARPGLDIELVSSVRGGTGCWYYKDENRIEPYVLEYDPDLVIIGGISQRDDIAAIRSCIEQIRAARPGMEIVLMTGIFGRVDPRRSSNWVEHVSAADDTYRGKLKKLAAEEHCEYLDLEGVWGRYLMDSGRRYGWFCRDYVHGNARGRQVAARALERFFGGE